MEDALFKDADSILYGTLVFGLFHFGRKNHGVIVLRPLGVILVQFRGNPVPVGNHSLLAVIADNERRNAAEILKRMVVHGNPLRFLGGYHSLSIDVLGIRQDGDKHHNVHLLPSEVVHKLEGLPGEIHLHLLPRDSCEVHGLLVLCAPTGVPLAELAILIGLCAILSAPLCIAVPEVNEGHVLAGTHGLVDLLKIRENEPCIPPM